MIKKSNKELILTFFLDEPTRGFWLRELERLSKLGLPSVRNYVMQLVEENLVKSQKIQRIILYCANRDSDDFKRIKIFHNIRSLYESGLIGYINDELSFPTIVLFGSKARGEDTEDSDVDLYVESPEKKLDVSGFEKIQVFLHKNLREIRNKHLVNNIANGIVLEGYLKVY
jgi:hypothetical protein